MASARYHTVLFLLCTAAQAAAQQATVRGRVLDAADGRPLQQAHVLDTDLLRGAVSDAQGVFVLPRPAEGTMHLRVTHLSFVTQEITWEPGAGDEGPLVRLQRRSVEMPPVEVYAGRPQVVLQRPAHHVGDHHVDHDGVWVLLYEQPRMLHHAERSGERILHGARLVLLDHALRERAATDLPASARALYTDHTGRPYVDGEYRAWSVVLDGDAIRLSALDRDTLHRAVLPWQHRAGNHVLGMLNEDPWPAVHHVALDPRSGEQRVLVTVEDKRTVELHRSEYKYMRGSDKVIAMDLGRQLGVDPEVVAGFMTGFRSSIHYRAPYAPLFAHADTVRVFDHAAGVVLRYDAALRPLDPGPMLHQRDKRFSHLLQDAATGTVYALSRQGPATRLCALDPTTGAAGTPFTLTHPFPQQVRVFDGAVYYIYREPGGTVRRALYRERIPER